MDDAIGNRDHGGDLRQAIARHGGGRAEWIDLSTGINPIPFPLPPIPAEAWARLPDQDRLKTLREAARATYGAPPEAAIAAFAGAQALIGHLPYFTAAGSACIVEPTYNEHRAAFEAAGWRVAAVDDPADAAGADALILVNPNNPDGRCWPGDRLAAIAGGVGLLVVDESFADVAPELSLVPVLDKIPNAMVLRSVGKFFGLAGLRLGFGCAGRVLADRLAAGAGPWPVSGPAIEIGIAALGDRDWAAETRARLKRDSARLDRLAAAAGWQKIGGTDLFGLYDVGDAVAVREKLAAHRIWSRIFPYSASWLRLGLAGDEAAWRRLERALA